MWRLFQGSTATIAVLLACRLSAAADEPGQIRTTSSNGKNGALSAAMERRRTPVVEVFEQARDAVVNVSTTRVVRMGPSFDIFEFRPTPPRMQRTESVGSGVVVHELGFIVTNAHVVMQATDVNVTFADKHSLPAVILASDPEHDLAILKVDAPEKLPTVKLGKAADVLVGETVVAIGNPLGLQHTVTTGIVSAVGRDLRFGDERDEERVRVYRGLIQTDAPINPGNSGGPLLNLNAELIGINTAIRGDAQNIGFAIPVERVWELVPALLDMEQQRRVRFGARINGENAAVLDVRAQSPAASAGLRPGDRVTRVNGTGVHDGIDCAVRLLAIEPGQEVNLGILRGKAAHELTIRPQIIPPPDGRALAERLLGLKIEEIPEEVRRENNLPVGIEIVGVVRGGPAARAGLRGGDLLRWLNRIPVRTVADVGSVLEKVESGHRVLVEGYRLEERGLFGWYVPLQAR